MAFALFKKSNQNQKCLDIPENMINAPFDQIIACMDHKYLEDAVSSHFEDILPYLCSEEYAYLRLYPSWMKLLSEHLEELMESFDTTQDFRELITAFPEFAPSIYEFLFQEFLADSNAFSLSIADDVLIPMADLEKYQGAHFPIVRKYALEIMKRIQSESYANFWDILQIFEQYFDMPREEFKEFLHNDIFNDILDAYENILAIGEDDGDDDVFFYYDEDIQDLKGIFMDSETYVFFMDKLPHFLKINGIEFYAMLIKILGPLPEIVSLHDACAEIANPK